MYHYIKGWTKFSFKKITLEELYQISRLPNCTPHTSLLTPIFPNVFFPTFLTKFGYVNNSMSEDIWQRLTGEFSIRRPLLNCEICLEKISKKKRCWRILKFYWWNHHNLKHISGWPRCSVFAKCLGTVFRNDVKMVDVEIRKYFRPFKTSEMLLTL